MKQGFLLVLLFCVFILSAQTKPFRFAFISDTHIGSPNGAAEEDLRRTVADINSMNDVAFVVITGDITELGTDEEIKLAKQILDSLDVPYYIIPGNHDTGWSESGGLSFTKIFGDEKFHFNYNGIHFLGCASGPYVRMSDGHVPRYAVNWLAKELKKISSTEPVIFLNHYPLDNGLDNWYEVIDLLKKKNTVLALCGHGHNNRLVQAEGIPAIMGRSNLRAKAVEGGYNLVDVRTDSFLFTERKPISKTERLWTKVQYKKQQYDLSKKFPRPGFSINQQYPQVSATWMYSSSANVISTPDIVNDLVVFGNQNGLVEALSLKNGKRKWRFQTGGPIFSSPAFSTEKIVFGSADGLVYCLNDKGKIQWKLKTGASVLGSPFIQNETVYIGGSDSCFQAIELSSGKPIWRFCGLGGPVTSKPVVYNETIIFGAWDRNLYALNKSNGKFLWKWNNGSPVINYSPAACIPVVHDDVVYIVAPDRYLSAIDIKSGQTLWRTNQSTVRESIGISEDGKMIYGKTMQDTIVAFYTNKVKAETAWKFFAGFGYEHTPSMLIEKNGNLFFGTKNGVVYALSLLPNPRINWAYKIDNSMVNTLNVIDDLHILAATMDGKVVLLQVVH
ncbi:MAG: PQQ-binding-like beta-propeller repeat protein [Bacteroidota bacterium]|nr:PQQ-binding-like beta-propeller repeat protein [Bacteroidota bacterium]